jgi:two-component system, chemotaxis family, sensor kinase CheA
MSTIDLGRFHQTFFDESAEGLDVMEAALLQLTPDGADAETVNSIFRAAHSIKGGAATFGFTAVAGFTHLLETLLDQLRSGARAISPVEIDVLLRSVDILRGLLDGARAGRVGDAGIADGLSAELRELLDGPAVAAHAAAKPVAEAVKTSGWKIHFAPHTSLFASGNDPLRILRELERIGDCEVVCHTEALPALGDTVPETCYLAWDIMLHTEAAREVVGEVFAWVEDECTLRIEPLAVQTAAVAQPSVAPAPAATVVPLAVAAAAPATPAPRAEQPPRSDSGSIRVATEKIDSLVNLVGELVITQAMLQQLAGSLDPVQHEKLFTGLSQLERNTRSIQEAVMATRMLPVDFVFSRFPRMVRDLAGKLGKQVRLVSSGEQTELDKSVIEKMVDPLTHLIRNAIDHGLEEPAERTSAGKAPVGTIRLSAAHQGGHIVLVVADDGRGLDRARLIAKARKSGIEIADSAPDSEVWSLIFAPGFSTAAAVTDVSGRGVGMDVVKKNIEALGGGIDLQSAPGAGMRVTIRLPLTLAILDAMSVRVGREILILPLNAVLESLQPGPGQVKTLTGQARVVKVRNEFLPMIDLADLFGIPREAGDKAEGILVVIEADDRKIAARVDELVGQQQVVIKSLEANYRRVRGISGATILGDGQVALILDCAALVRQFSTQAQAA